MRIMRTLVLLLAIYSLPLAAQTPKELTPAVLPSISVHASAAAAPAQSPVKPAPLTKADVDSWLDGFMPYALDTGDIAGAVVVVVKDGQVLTQRGFGYADVKSRKLVDPATTLFRPGSISKTFTWTAVMQLVQAGKIDLDRDVSTYLDFKIPPAFGKPITMRDLMTHTAGFEESAKYLIVFDPRQKLALDRVLKRWIPRRIYAPGAMPAYSNYGATLAGYIVQRVSGEPFDDYIQHNIFTPLGMARSTFAQPLPPAFVPDVAVGYVQASGEPQRFEIISLAPAGALTATGADMAKFMIAHLSDGGAILSPKTAALMHAPANTPIPGMPPMALGFYHEDQGGRTIIGHAGDTNFFHSDMHLFVVDHVGLFLSFNSAGKAGAARTIRERLFAEFVRRYFPPALGVLPTAATAHAHGSAMTGTYISSRASETTFLKAFNLIGGTSVGLNPDDTITVAALVNAAGVPKRWREIGPWQWQEVGGSDRLGAAIRNGHVALFAPASTAPIIEFVPASPGVDIGWIAPVAGAAMLVMLITALSWPIVALVRRGYGYRADLVGRSLLLHRVTRATAWAMLIVAGGWVVLVSILSSDAAAFDGRLDGPMRLLQIVLILATVGTVLAIWNAYMVNMRPGRHRISSGWSILVALSAVFLAWLALNVNLLTPSLDF